ncbi:uncharacterized protein LOC134840541 isoform X2 [Symsagittifera roscoffensis]|uniref:uncharacterized protein LOC134840541 isoform X2 n=1 Tax=Symsagittifera roscoffensis TaxID=84072 RepID=UPI00307CBFB3
MTSKNPGYISPEASKFGNFQPRVHPDGSLVDVPRSSKGFPMEDKHLEKDDFYGPVPKSSDTRASDASQSSNGRMPEVRSSCMAFVEAVGPQVPGAANWYLRIFWVLAYIGLTAVFIIQFINLVDLYLQYKVDTSLSLVRSTSATFPAITLCNNSPVKKSKLEKIRRYSDLAMLDDYVESEMMQSVEEDFDIDLPYSCDPNDFHCINTGECIPWEWVCDGVAHCDDGLDEGWAPFGADANNYTTGEKVNCTGYTNPTQNMGYSQHNTDNYCEDGYVRCNRTDEPVCAAPCDDSIECSNGFDESPHIGCVEVLDCGSAVALTTSVPQEILSPDYPNGYDNDKTCEWTVTSAAGTKISVTFNHMEVEIDQGECRDYLNFRDGGGPGDPMIKVDGTGRVCGDQTSPTGFDTTANELFIRFVTDRSYGWPGFNLTVTSSPVTKKRARRDISARTQKTLERKFREKSARKRRTASADYDPANYGDDINYDVNFWENYDTWYNSYDPYDHYDDNMAPYDWIEAYEKSNKPDYSDFRSFALFTQNEVKFFGTQAVDFIAQCTFDGRVCSYDSFQTYQNPKYGNCFLFNTIFEQSVMSDGSFQGIRSTSRTGQEYGLKVTLFIDEEEYIGVLSQNVGAQVLLTSPNAVPLPESEGIQLAVGYNTRVAMRQEQIQRRGGNYGTCHASWPTDAIDFSDKFLDTWPFYSQKICEVYCVQTYIYDRCDCTDHYLEGFNQNRDDGDNAMCSMWNVTQRDCVRDIYSQYRSSNLTCPCYSQCDSDVYQYASSSTEWPSPQFTPYLVQVLRKNSESEVIQQYLWDLLGDSSNGAMLSDTRELAKELRKQFLRVEVFFEELNFQLLKESPSYTMTNLMSDFGGNIGLWIGWSVLTFLEIAVLTINLLKILLFGKAC